MLQLRPKKEKRRRRRRRMKNVTLIKVCALSCWREQERQPESEQESEFHVLKDASCRKIGTHIFILLRTERNRTEQNRTERVDEDGSLVGSLFWFSWESVGM
jgi:hypothetical protein